MRNDLCNTLVSLSKQWPMVFLTGDVGYSALEPLREVLQERFINAGVAEQNMVSVAAGLALAGLQAWVYSIAPFVYARPFEQVRNDLCLNKIPVKLIGNGGGYFYGSMGGTHHALEDYGILGSLPNMHIFVPAFSADIVPIVSKMTNLAHPSYLRLDRSALPKDFELPTYNAWRCLLQGDGPLMVCVGALVGPLWEELSTLDYAHRPEIWVVSELPLSMETIDLRFLSRLKTSSRLVIVEEHVAQGSFGQNLVWLLQMNHIAIPYLQHCYAQGYPSGTYGSQSFHRIQSGLDPVSIKKMIIA